jgi:hypothetical protein
MEIHTLHPLTPPTQKNTFNPLFQTILPEKNLPLLLISARLSRKEIIKR